MKTKHTAGQLRISRGPLGFELYTEDREAPCVSIIRANVREDAERLAACWNACEGINPEAVPDILAALKFIRSSLTAKRTDNACTLTLEAFQKMTAAIAKAGGVS